MLPLPSMAMAAPGKTGHCISPTQGLHWELAAARPVPASLSNCRDNCHKSNCSCWIMSILHHHPQLLRTHHLSCYFRAGKGSSEPGKAKPGLIWAPEAKSTG